ncbi:MAG TPA: hypothetical protein VHY09_00310 [Candidatus Methylacidiphilales bacterium]|jgi:hypothetical protein|nr:hypothetical protein [Candidatus Methylacidiphilales bacterium]
MNPVASDRDFLIPLTAKGISRPEGVAKFLANPLLHARASDHENHNLQSRGKKMKKHSIMPVTRSLFILVIALTPALLSITRADAPAAKKSTPMVAVDPVTFNWVDGEPIHTTVYVPAPKK